jgi:hypothetical protein
MHKLVKKTESLEEGLDDLKKLTKPKNKQVTQSSGNYYQLS